MHNVKNPLTSPKDIHKYILFKCQYCICFPAILLNHENNTIIIFTTTKKRSNDFVKKVSLYGLKLFFIYIILKIYCFYLNLLSFTNDWYLGFSFMFHNSWFPFNFIDYLSNYFSTFTDAYKSFTNEKIRLHFTFANHFRHSLFL
jgi:hypothetical protein